MENTLDVKSPQSNNSRHVERIENNEIFTKVRSNSKDSNHGRFYDRDRNNSFERRNSKDRRRFRRENSAENTSKILSLNRQKLYSHFKFIEKYY